jgi:signal transduction histidine kinase
MKTHRSSVAEWFRVPFQRLYSSTTGYALALVATALAALLRWSFPWALAPAPYLGFYPAVVVSAALGGVGPGLMATFASLLLVNFVFGRFDVNDHGAMARQVVWVAASIGVSLLAGMQRAARMRERRQAEELRRWNDELEIRVQERTAEIQEANRQLRAANEKLAELDHAKTAFFSNISHEFRTPLTLMLGPLEDALAKRDSRSPADRETLNMVHRNALRLLRLVNTLLDFSSIESGRIQAVYEPIDLAVLTADLASIFRSAVERAGITLNVDCAPLSEPVYVDRDMWEKIVLNLLSNALKFTLQGGITVRLARADAMAELTVADTGIGIEPHELPHLFERFHRVHGAKGRTFEGTGIGLALVKDLIKLHGGSVSVASVYGRGSTFTLRLPLGTAHLPADRIGASATPVATATGAAPFLEESLRWLPDRVQPAAATADVNVEGLASSAQRRAELRSAAGTGAGPRPRVLFADDNADLRDYVGRLLEAVYDVHAVADGEAALAAALAAPPDLVLSDIMMPGLDGFELLQALRKEPKTATIPVILLSARAGEESRIEGLEAGADDYLTKPFSARELVARVRTNLEMARSRRESVRLEERLKAEERTAEELREQAGVLEFWFRERTAELQRSNQALQDFAAIASHDLQEPLRKVNTFASMLKQKYCDSLGEPGTGYLERVLDANQRMQSLLTALLEYSRISTKADPFVEVELTKVIHEVLSDLEVRIQGTGGEVHVGELPVIQADPTQMRQLFQNLIGNGLKFHREEEKPLVSILSSTSKRTFQIVVEDNGIGFEEQYLEKIFAPFQRLHGKNSQYEGTGMGLAICKKIVERHGGSITARSEPGKGSKFLITLPQGPPDCPKSIERCH